MDRIPHCPENGINVVLQVTIADNIQLKMLCTRIQFKRIDIEKKKKKESAAANFQ